MIRYMPYDHARHAGNPGDVWKHFILAEVADHLLAGTKNLTYVESHAGYPEYVLTGKGEWTSGIGRLWGSLADLRGLTYFDVLAGLNPWGLSRYPGSAILVLELASRRDVPLVAHLWDLSPSVARAWAGHSASKRVVFRRGDGFSGVSSLLEKAIPGLLLVDSPYTREGDLERSENLFQKASEAGWLVLCWYMDPIPQPRCDYRTYELKFEDLGMDGGRWMSAYVAVAGVDEDLARRLQVRTKDLIRMFRLKNK